MYKSFWKCNRTIQQMLDSRGYGDQIEIEDDQIDHSKLIETYAYFETKLLELCRSINEGSESDGGELNQKVLDRLTYLRQHSFTGEWIYIFFVMNKIGVQVSNFILQ